MLAQSGNDLSRFNLDPVAAWERQETTIDSVLFSRCQHPKPLSSRYTDYHADILYESGLVDLGREMLLILAKSVFFEECPNGAPARRGASLRASSYWSTCCSTKLKSFDRVLSLSRRPKPISQSFCLHRRPVLFSLPVC